MSRGWSGGENEREHDAFEYGGQAGYQEGYSEGLRDGRAEAMSEMAGDNAMLCGEREAEIEDAIERGKNQCAAGPWRPIAEAPFEIKDGREVMLKIENKFVGLTPTFSIRVGAFIEHGHPAHPIKQWTWHDCNGIRSDDSDHLGYVRVTHFALINPVSNETVEVEICA